MLLFVGQPQGNQGLMSGPQETGGKWTQNPKNSQSCFNQEPSYSVDPKVLSTTAPSQGSFPREEGGPQMAHSLSTIAPTASYTGDRSRVRAGADPSQMVGKSHTLPDSVAPCETGCHVLKRSMRTPTYEHCSEPSPG